MTHTQDEAWTKRVQRAHRIQMRNDALIDKANERVRAWWNLVRTGVCFECLERKAESGRSGMCSECDKATKQEWRRVQSEKGDD